MAIRLMLLFAACIHIAASQCNLKLSGQVIDLDDGSELHDCVVMLMPHNTSIVTNNHGRFVFADLCSGTYTIVVKHIGCRDTAIKVQLSGSSSLKIKMPHSAYELKEIDIMDKRTEIKSVQIKSDLESEDLDKSRGQTLGEALKTISGVTSLNTGATISKPMIHGMQGYRILIVNNGVRHEGQQWGNEHAPEVDPFIASKISVIKGASSIRYGSDALGGVVLVEAPELPDTVSVTGEFNTVGMLNGRAGIASGILQGNFEKIKNFSWRIQGTYKKAGNIKTPTYFLKNTGVQEYNFSYALSYHKKRWGTEVYYSQFNTKVGVFSGAHIHNLTDLQNALQLRKPIDSNAVFTYEIGRPFQQIEHEMVKSKTHIHLSEKWRLLAQYAYQYNKRFEYDKHKPLNDSLAALNLPELDYRIQTQTAEVIAEHDNIRSFRGQFGVQYMNQINNYWGRFFIPNYINNTWGIFVSERIVKQHAEFELGLRYDEKYLQSYFYENNQLVSPFLKFNNFNWNTGMIYKPSSAVNLFFNLGSAWRSPAPNELYSNGIHHGVGAIERGNKELDPEKVINATISALIHKKYQQVEATVYHNQFGNFIYMNPAPHPELTVKGAFPVFEFKQARARISGADLKISHNIADKIQLTAKCMWLRAWNYTINDYLIYMPSDRYQLDARYFIQNKKQRFYVGASWQYVTKQWRVSVNTDFAPPPQAYHLVGAELGGNFMIKKQPLVLSIRADNLLNAVYRDYLDRFRYYCDAQGRNITLRIKVPLMLYTKKTNNE